MRNLHLIKAFTQKRMGAFDDGDVDGAMAGWAKEGSTFIVSYPKAPSAEELRIEGFEAIKGLETQFAQIIKENYGRSWHEMVTWKWQHISEEQVDVAVYCRLWLTQKTGGWKQQDLDPTKTGRFWMHLKHKKIGGEWKIVSQQAVSEDEDEDPPKAKL